MTVSILARTVRAIVAVAAMAPALSLAEIVLGHSGDLSGTSAALTKDYVRGMAAYFDELNRKGGIRGEKIKLVSLDDGFIPDRTAENTKALIDQNALALVGLRGTANVQKIVPLLQAAGIAEIGNTSGAKSLRDPHVPNLFHLRASTSDEIEAAVNHAWTIGITRIAAAYQDDAFGKEGVDALTASLKKRDSAPVALAPVPRGTVDVAKAIDTVAAAHAAGRDVHRAVQARRGIHQRRAGQGQLAAVLRAERGLGPACRPGPLGRGRHREPGGSLSVHRTGQPRGARVPEGHEPAERQEIQLQQHGGLPERQDRGDRARTRPPRRSRAPS